MPLEFLTRVALLEQEGRWNEAHASWRFAEAAGYWPAEGSGENCVGLVFADHLVP